MQKLFAGILFSISFVFLLVTASVMLTKNPSEKEKSAAFGGLILGVPALAGGTAIMLGVRKNRKQSQSDLERQLEAIFLEVIQNNGGRVSVIDFSIASKLSLAESKQYLDNKASELNGDFHVNDEGKISYLFDF
ncbi:MAG: hypothetical protein MH252_00695 [Thermosynechococcaceae cyanobacterium MS004]|nr:hypothetical protein [Thermosynechococcaceae cyanobacterium MS004]